MTDQHPMRKWTVYVYHCPDAPESRRYVAFFSEPQASICFWGSDHREVLRRAEDWRDRRVEANEAAYQNRMEAIRKGRERRAKKKAEKSA